MSITKRIFGRIWAFWGLIVFVSTMIIFLIPFLLFCYFRSEPKKTFLFVRFSRVWMGTFLGLIGCPLKIRGKQHFRKGETYIVVCNHNSLIDVPASSPGIPGGNKTIAKIEMSKVPVFGMIYKTGAVLVDRKSEASRRESFGKMKDVLNMGLHMCIYPEGTRNKSNQPLKSFHDGAFRLALSTGKEIVPALIFNSKRALPINYSFLLLPHRLSMHFLEPVALQETDTVESLKQRVFEIMSQYYAAHEKSEI
jgi:1-acyl-sn-glycerol-3-phosphate acyltransferase